MSAKTFTTGNDSELIERVPITREPGRSHKAMKLELPTLDAGGQLRISAECQVTTDEAVYSYAPRVAAHLAGGSLSATSKAAVNSHHHVFYFWRVLRLTERWPADPLLLSLRASHPGARNDDTLLVGQNEPDGSVDQDAGRLNALWVSADAKVQKFSSRHLKPVVPIDKEKRTVISSVQVKDLRKGDQIEVRSLYSFNAPDRWTRLTTRVILADRPEQDEPRIGGHADEVCPYRAEFSEANGSNVRGDGQVRKAGVLPVRVDQRKPLFVNVVAIAADPQRPTGSHGDVKLKESLTRAWVWS